MIETINQAILSYYSLLDINTITEDEVNKLPIIKEINDKIKEIVFLIKKL
jgi:hypothetical protein